jgi:hypothetical protein
MEGTGRAWKRRRDNKTVKLRTLIKMGIPSMFTGLYQYAAPWHYYYV